MADSIFSGLESFGFGGLDNLDIYEEEKKKEEAVKAAAPKSEEKDFLFDKTEKCPCCEHQFKTRRVKTSSAKFLGVDLDLRQLYEGIDVTKYEVILCPKCGYAAMARFFQNIGAEQKKAVKEKITKNFKAYPGVKETISYDDAIETYKMALLNAVVKSAKASEKAYICLKLSWLYRGKAEEVGKSSTEYSKLKENELEFSKNAYDGLANAVLNERFPICGMDGLTVDYLLAALGTLTGHLDVASKLVGKILTSKNANNRIKDKARDLKEEILKIRGENKQ